MSRMLLILLGIVSISILGCGERPAGDGGPDGADQGDGAQPAEITLETVDLAVGQWVSYGLDDEAGEVKISAVAEEVFQGANCIWLQLEIPGEEVVVQILVDPALMAGSMEDYSGMVNEFMDDPSAWIAEHQDTQAMFTDEENIDNMIAFISALKMFKVLQEGQIIAFDLSNVPATIQPVLQDPQFIAQMQSGMEMNAQTGDLDSIQAVLDQSEFSIEQEEISVSGTTLDCVSFSMVHEKGSIAISFSEDLPILPLARATFTENETGESHTVEVRDFGMDGAVNLIEGTPAAVIDAAQYVQQMIGMMNSQGGMAPNQ